MVAATDRTARAQPCRRAACLEHFEKELESSCPFHRGQVEHLLKDYATMKVYIRSTLSQQGKAQKPTRRPMTR